MVGMKGSAMLIKSIPVGELLPGDILRDDFTTADDEAIANNTLDIIRQALATPTRTSPKEEHYNKARRVQQAPKVKRVYTYLTMGTYAVLGQRNGTLVSVYRNGGNGQQDVSPVVLEHTPECASYLSDYATGESYVCDCSVGNGVRVTHTVQASTVGNITYPAMVETLPAETEEVPYGPERQLFNYARSQFRQLGNYRETEYPTKLKIQNDNGETRWMDIHPEDLAELQRLMEVREDNS